MSTAKVIRSTGKFYDIIDLDDHQKYVAVIRGKFKNEKMKLTNPVAVGDIVDYFIEDQEVAVITKIHARTNYVVRQSPRKKHFLHLLASNVYQAMLIVTIVEPKLKQGFIDRFLLMTEPYNIPVTIVFNKADLYNEADHDVFNFLKNIYEAIGYRVILCSALTGQGIEEIRAVLKDKSTLIGGQSGVGKSTLANSIDQTLELRTSEISDYSGKGQHTTTFAEMFMLPFGGNIIDTPGIKTLGFNHLEVLDVAHNFREFFTYSNSCKFANCTHRKEPHCAVKDAIEKGKISELRYQNYLVILEELEDQNYWERISEY